MLAVSSSGEGQGKSREQAEWKVERNQTTTIKEEA